MGLWVSKRARGTGCLSLVAWAALACLAAANPAHAQEVQHYPAPDTYGSVIVEDGWPQQLDQDYNDVAFRYNMRIYRDASGKVSQVLISMHIQAHGGTMSKGLALQFPFPASTPHIAQIQRDQEDSMTIEPMTGEPKLTFVFYDEIREAFSDTAGGDIDPGEFINTDKNLPVRRAETIAFEVQFDPPLDFSLDPPFDLFVFRTAEYAHQIHLSNYGPTDVALENPAIADLFGSEDDCSAQVCIAPDGSTVDNTGRWYVNNQGLPWAIEVAAEIQWPVEGKSIELAYPQFLGWAASGGETNTDWYLFGDPEYLYDLFLLPGVPGLLPGPAWVLLGVMAALGALRLRGRR
ncbi:MAG: LruC domain-containing protein [Myxococcota bacterium]